MTTLSHPTPTALPERLGPGALSVLIALCAICFGLVPFFARGLMAEGVPPVGVALYRYAFSLTLMLPFLPLAREHRRELLLSIGAGVALSLGWLGYVEALRGATVAVVGVIYMSYPLFTILFAAIILGQRLTRRAIISGGLIIAAALIAAPWQGGFSVGGMSFLLHAIMAPIGFALAMVIVFGKVVRLAYCSVVRLPCWGP